MAEVPSPEGSRTSKPIPLNHSTSLAGPKIRIVFVSDSDDSVESGEVQSSHQVNHRRFIDNFSEEMSGKEGGPEEAVATGEVIPDKSISGAVDVTNPSSASGELADLVASVVGQEVFVSELCLLTEEEIKERFSDETYTKFLAAYYEAERERVLLKDEENEIIKDVSLKEVSRSISCALAEEKREEQGQNLGLSNRLVSAEEEDRAHLSEKEMCLYWRSAQCGLGFPLTDFVVDLLQVLDIAPSQLIGPAWCHICNFERMFYAYEEFDDLVFAKHSVSLFLEFYTFFETSSWIGVKRRPGEIFKGIGKVNQWEWGFYYLPIEDADQLWASKIRHSWKIHNVVLPGRRMLTPQESALRLRFEQVRDREEFAKGIPIVFTGSQASLKKKLSCPSARTDVLGRQVVLVDRSSRPSSSAVPPTVTDKMQSKLPSYLGIPTGGDADPKVSFPEGVASPLLIGTKRPASSVVAPRYRVKKKKTGDVRTRPLARKGKQIAESPSEGEVVTVKIPFGKKVRESTVVPSPLSLAQYDFSIFDAATPRHLKQSLKRQTVPNLLSSAMRDLLYVGCNVSDACHRFDEVDNILSGRFPDYIQKKIDAETEALVTGRNILAKERQDFLNEENAFFTRQKRLAAEKEALEKKVAELSSLNEQLLQENASLKLGKDTLSRNTEGLNKENTELKATCARLEESLKVKDVQLRAKDDELLAERNGAELAKINYLQRFLNSKVFETAAYATTVSALRLGCYAVLYALSSVYPFKPEELGFHKVDKLVGPDLSSHRWDETQDQLVSAVEGVLETPPNCIPDLSVVTVKHPWEETSAPWPEDMYDDEGEGLGVDSQPGSEKTLTDEQVRQLNVDEGVSSRSKGEISKLYSKDLS